MYEQTEPVLMLVGLNHRVAPITLREALAVPPDRLPGALEALRAYLAQPEPASMVGQKATRCAVSDLEVALVSTCNRYEIYLSTLDPCGVRERLESWLASRVGVPLHKIRDASYCLLGKAAARHLLRVAAGLDSLVVGENEIQGQVRTAYEAARMAGTAGAQLAAVFQASARSGKRVRCETELGQARRSVARMVVDLANQTIGDLQSHTALIIGAGKISTLAAQALVHAGLRCVLVANRTYQRAYKLAQTLGAANAQAVHFDALQQVLQQADIVICSTSAPHLVLHEAMVREAMNKRPGRSLLVADLALPRDVDPRVGQIPGVSLANIDDLEELVFLHYPLAASVRSAAEDVVQQELDCYNEWLQARRVAPLIQALHAQADAICEHQVALTLRRMGPLSKEQEEQLRKMAEAIASHLLHEPITKLKAASQEKPEHSSARCEDFGQLVEMLFGLHEIA
jgi:glutamyl-tRNA reductase